jgi:hypothetical protein
MPDAGTPVVDQKLAVQLSPRQPPT